MLISTEIASVGQVPVKPYEGKFGATWFIDGEFKDGSFFSRGAKSVDGAQKLQSQLTELVGKPNSFEVEDTNREYQGRKKWNLKAVPGQPSYQGGYGYKGGSTSTAPATASKSGYSGSTNSSYRYSEEGTKEERDSIVRQVALKCAVEVCCTEKSAGGLFILADRCYAWLTTKPVQEVPPFERYSNEISRAVREKNATRLDALMGMIKTSLAKGSLNIDQVAALDDELVSGRKAMNSTASLEAWTKQQQDKARQTEPLHESPAMADTIQQSQEAF